MSTQGDDFRRTDINHPKELYRELDGRLFALAGWINSGPGRIGEFMTRAEEVERNEGSWRAESDKTLKAKILDFKQQFRRRPRGCEKLLPYSLAALREAAGRRLGLNPYPVQLAGALALYEGFLIEMATGEGKTLTAALAAVLHGWSGYPCHVITVNDYLAERDTRWMEPLYSFCGVSVGHVVGGMEYEARREGYSKEVTYTTNKEIVADFLRDRLWLGKLQHAGRRSIARLLGASDEIDRGLVMHGIHTAIVDEADSLLIDEAVTPLIISHSMPNDFFLEACKAAHEIAATLERDVDYLVNDRYKEIELLPRLERKLERHVESARTGYRNLSGYRDLVRQALSAREHFHRDHQYVVQEGKVVIVDEFTGRQMPQRTWRFGLHQLIEAKEKLEMSPPTETLARLSFQRFYRFFHHLSGMTGTASEARQELWAIYHLPLVTIPENRPCRRRIYRARAFGSIEEKYRSIVEEIGSLHSAGRPVLVGTRSVHESEELSARLERAGLKHMVLNAVRHREEAGVISLAGLTGAVTIATNMAGRGTDIKLGKGVAEIGGLHVIACECNESRRIDRQLFGRCARQGDPGSGRLYVSMEDALILRFVPAVIRVLVSVGLRRRIPGSRLLAVGAVAIAQAVAQRLAMKRRRSVLRMDTWLERSLSFAHREVG